MQRYRAPSFLILNFVKWSINDGMQELWQQLSYVLCPNANCLDWQCRVLAFLAAFRNGFSWLVSSQVVVAAFPISIFHSFLKPDIVDQYCVFNKFAYWKCNLWLTLFPSRIHGKFLFLFDISWFYQQIRDRNAVRLYIAFNVMEIFDRFCLVFWSRYARFIYVTVNFHFFHFSVHF